MTTRDIVSEETARAGEHRQRVLSLVDRLHRDGAISFDEFAAAGILRNALMLEIPPSEGISSYGGNIGHADGATKADRLGQRLTGFQIDYEGHVYYRGGRLWNDHRRNLEDALFAAVGVHDDSGARRVNAKHADLLVRIVLDADDVPTLAGIARELTSYYGQGSKRPAAFALGAV
jgi:hypothetical protein